MTPNESNQIWYLDTSNGPRQVDLASLMTWAATGQMHPNQQVGRSGMPWMAARNVPALRDKFTAEQLAAAGPAPPVAVPSVVAGVETAQGGFSTSGQTVLHRLFSILCLVVIVLGFFPTVLNPASKSGELFFLAYPVVAMILGGAALVLPLISGLPGLLRAVGTFAIGIVMCVVAFNGQKAAEQLYNTEMNRLNAAFMEQTRKSAGTYTPGTRLPIVMKDPQTGEFRTIEGEVPGVRQLTEIGPGLVWYLFELVGVLILGFGGFGLFSSLTRK